MKIFWRKPPTIFRLLSSFIGSLPWSLYKYKQKNIKQIISGWYFHFIKLEYSLPVKMKIPIQTSIIFVIIFAPIQSEMVTATLGSAVFVGVLSAIGLKCRFYECCTDRWITNNFTGNLYWPTEENLEAQFALSHI